MKKIILAIIAVFVAWSLLDYVIHGMLLGRAYQETAQLWRPMAEMKMGLMYVVSLLSATSFVLIYAYLITNTSIKNGLLYGLLYGFGVGVSMGYGSYSYMPITYQIAITWFLGTVVEMAVAGLLTAAIIKADRVAAA